MTTMRTKKGTAAPSNAAIQVFEAPTLQEAILKVKLALGENAVIHDTRNIQKGSLFTRILTGGGTPMVQVMASKPEVRTASPARRKKNYISMDEIGEATTPELKSSDAVLPQPVRSSETAKALTQNILPYRSGNSDPDAIEMPVRSEVRKPALEVSPGDICELDSLSLLRQMAMELQGMKGEIRRLQSQGSDPGGNIAIRLPEKLEKMNRILKRNELNDNLSQVLLERLGMLGPERLDDWDCVKSFAIEHLADQMNVGGPIDMDIPRQGPRVVAFVGPTGVGKTTTLAKLAADFTLKRKKKVAFLTLDTFRVAAIEQLKTYAEIIGIPMRVVFKTDEIPEALQEFGDKDLVLMDTAGRSLKSPIEMLELKSYFEEKPMIETYLVMSATTRYSDMQKILETFGDVGIDKLVVTKVDETDTFGPIVNLAVHSQIPIAYVTNGQNIPDNYQIADAVRLIRQLVENV